MGLDLANTIAPVAGQHVPVIALLGWLVDPVAAGRGIWAWQPEVLVALHTLVEPPPPPVPGDVLRWMPPLPLAPLVPGSPVAPLPPAVPPAPPPSVTDAGLQPIPASAKIATKLNPASWPARRPLAAGRAMRSLVIGGCLAVMGRVIRTHARWFVSNLIVAGFLEKLRAQRG